MIIHILMLSDLRGHSRAIEAYVDAVEARQSLERWRTLGHDVRIETVLLIGEHK